jgi:2-methylcitrate dehydratase PrpD
MITKQVAHYAASLKYEAIGPEVLDRTKQLLLDFLGVALGGRALAPTSDAFIKGVGRVSGQGDCSVAGEKNGYPAHYAALLNAAFGHSMDFDDTHRDAVMHQGTPLFSALLAASEEQGGVSGKQFLTASVAGYEIGGKLGLAHRDRVHVRGFHPTATTGIFAATAGVGSLLGLDAATIEDALGHDLGMSSGSGQFTSGGGALKPLQVGMAAHNALYAIAMAREGLPGTREPLEGPFGYFATYSEPGSDPEKVHLDLESPREVLAVGLKPYPCCRCSHATIDGVTRIVMEHALKPEEIDSIEVALPPVGFQLVGARPDEKRRPQGLVDAQFSVYFAAASSALDGKYSWDSYKRLGDPALVTMMDRVTVRPSEALVGMGAQVTLASKRGTTTLDLPLPKGEPELPLTWDEVEGKFLSLAREVLGMERSLELAARVRGIEDAGDVAEIARLLRG